jgi:hypothetical protein
MSAASERDSLGSPATYMLLRKPRQVVTIHGQLKYYFPRLAKQKDPAPRNVQGRAWNLNLG